MKGEGKVPRRMSNASKRIKFVGQREQEFQRHWEAVQIVEAAEQRKKEQEEKKWARLRWACGIDGWTPGIW